jgi:hypothetical protein
MADGEINDGVEDYGTIADQVSAGVLKNLPLDSVRDMIVGAIVQAKHGQNVSMLDLGVELAVKFGELLAKAEEPFMPVIAGFIAPIVAGLFGTDVDAEAFARRADRGSRGAASAAIVESFMSSLAGDDGGEVPPGDGGAKRIATAAVHATLEGQLQALATSLLSDIVPFEIGHFDELVNLPEDIIRTLGVSRLVRRAFSPLVDATAATPMKRFANQKYRPNLLAEADIIRAFIAGDYSRDEAGDELAQLGYSDRRQDILLKHATKFLAVADALVLIRDGQYDRQFAIENLRAQGYDQVGAEQAVLVEEVKHLNAIRDDSAAALKAAYVDRRISDGALDTYLSAIYASDEDRSAYVTAWRTIRDVNTKRLSPSEAEACVVAKVLPIAAYREALTLDGYSDEAVIALELLLETKLNANADVEKLRRDKADEAAAAKQAAADAAKAKADALEQQRALARRGSLAALQRAVVRGLIPTSRYAEVLTPQYDADTVATMIALVEQDRADYVAQQQKAADATKRATLRHIDVGGLQTAYLDNVITLDQVRTQLDALQFDPTDAGILLATMEARKADLDAAKKDRADAAAKAKVKSIDLSKFETLVRRGHRSIAEYAALLGSLGYDAGSVAAMVDLLQLQIADDQAARDARAKAAAKTDAVGLTLEQMRRAVILGAKTADDFSAYLVANKYTLDAQGVLVAELRNDVAEAEAARAKRHAAESAAVDTHAPLATVAQAARLGIIAPDVYEQRLRAAHYTDDDIAIEMDLLAVEIADVQAQRAKAAAAEAKANDPALSLDTLARAVKVGVATMDDYRARAIEIGYSSDEIATLVGVLEQEVQQVQAAEARRAVIEGQLKQRNLSISELDAAVKAGQLTIDQYNARLLTLGYGADDADLLTTLLQLKLAAAPAAGGGQ